MTLLNTSQASNGNGNPFRRNNNSPTGSGNSRLPGRLPASQNNQNNNNQGSRFGSSRFGNATESITWTVEPASDSAVRFDLKGLGDPYYRLLGERLDVDCHDLNEFIKVLQGHKEWYDKLIDKLNASWESYGFDSGAILLYPNLSVVWNAYNGFVHPLPPPPEKPQQQANDQDEEYVDDEPEQPPQPTRTFRCYRAIDIGLVLNVLGRARGQVLVANTPLALEVGFLNRSFICDDPRLVAIAEMTGCIEETWT